MVPCVPFRGERQAVVQSLLQGELSAGAIRVGDNASREVVSTKFNTRALFPLFREGCVSIISRAVGPLENGEKEIIPGVKGPSRGLALPKPPLYRWRDIQLVQPWRTQSIEIHSNFDSVPYANDNARRKRGQGIDWAHSAIHLSIDPSFIQDIRTGNVEYGFLRVGAADWKGGKKEQQELE